MSKVTISLNGRAFTIGCEEGQQAHIADLAHAFGQLAHMAALIVGDELREAQGRIEALEDTLTDTRGRLSQAEARRRADRARAAEALNAAAARLEALAAEPSGDEEDA